MANPCNADWNNFWDRSQSKKFRQVSWSKRRMMRVLKPYLFNGARVLDAGCGSGFFSRFFCEQGMKVTSVDYSDSALAVAKQTTKGRSKIIKADLMRADLTTCLDEKVTLIFSDGLFEHFSQKEQNKIMANFSSVLHDDGVVVTFVPNRWSPWELIRPFFMPGIEETPFVLKELVDLNQRNHLHVVTRGGVNTLPIKYSPDKFMAATFGMLLYTVAKKKI